MVRRFLEFLGKLNGVHVLLKKLSLEIFLEKNYRDRLKIIDYLSFVRAAHGAL